MNSINALFNQFNALLKKAITTNEIWQFVISLCILCAGFVILEIIWRRGNRSLESSLEKMSLKEWLPYLAGFLPPVRLATAAMLIRSAEIPLSIPPKLLVLLHGIESFLLVLALLFFIFQMIHLLDLLTFALPPKARKKFSETVVKNLQSVLRITGLIIVAGIFVYTQKYLLPVWLLKSTWWRYAFLLALFAILFMAGKLLAEFLESMTSALKDYEEKTRLRLVLRAAVWPIRLFLLALAFYAVQEILALPAAFDKTAESIASIFIALAVIIFLYRLLDVVEYELTRFVTRDDNEFDLNLVQLARVLSRVLVITFGFIFLLKAATGKPMTTLLAGLGIGGLAVALAAQDTLKNLFGSFMLMIDKPFVVGDWVYVEGEHATVEEIGLRSTRIRTFGGHVITIPNEKMAAMSIENVQRRPFIRRWLNVTITYDTPPDKVEKAVSIIKDILTDRPELDPEHPARVYFNEFNDASLNIMAAYWFKKTDYWESVAFNERINFEIMRAYEKEGIEFAFPTTTTYLAHDNRRPLTIAISGETKRPESENEE